MFADDANGVLIYVIDHPVCHEHLFASPKGNWTVATWHFSASHWHSIFAFHGTAICAVRLAHTFDPLFPTKWLYLDKGMMSNISSRSILT